MRTPRSLPANLPRSFTVAEARAAGIEDERLRRRDLDRPFHGVRSRPRAAGKPGTDDFAAQAGRRCVRAREYAPRLRPGHFFSHETAVALYGGPVPLETDEFGVPLTGVLPLHVSTLGDGPLVRTAGVVGHRADARVARFLTFGDLRVASPATAWAQLGGLSLLDLVALGDYFCRVWRPGYGRPDAGRPALASIDELREQLRFGGRPGIRRLRDAADLVREDSWSPRESRLRVEIVHAGLPEPVLNHDVFDDGRFIACVDLAYPDRKIAIEYHGRLHAESYARDVERMAALRAAGWVVIEVASELLRHPETLMARIRAALAR